MNTNTDYIAANARVKHRAKLGVIIGTALWTAFFFLFLIISALYPSALQDSWFLSMIQQQPAGTLGVAMAAISSFSVVAVLDVFANDPIEIRFFQFELKGAAGPVILWTLSFLSFIAGINILWKSP